MFLVWLPDHTQQYCEMSLKCREEVDNNNLWENNEGFWWLWIIFNEYEMYKLLQCQGKSKFSLSWHLEIDEKSIM